MTEFSDQTPQAFPPRDALSYVPHDPFNTTVVQFGALKDLGYPVDLTFLSRADAKHRRREILGDTGQLEALYNPEHEEFSVWCEAKVLEPEFTAYVYNSLPLAIEMPSISAQNRQALERHPAQLVHAVDNGWFDTAKRYLVDIIKNGRPAMAKDGQIGGVAIGCYMLAMERSKHKHSIDPKYVTYGGGVVSREDVLQYQRFKNAGYKAAGPEALGSLVLDYYTLLGEFIPDFVAFRG